MQKVIAFLVKKVITVVMIVFSFFIKGDMTKVEMQPEEQVKAGASSATFIFENKTGKTLDLHIYVESVEMEKNGKWEEVPYVQMLDDVDFVNLPIFILEKRRISRWNSSREPSIPSLFPCPWRQATTV